MDIVNAILPVLGVVSTLIAVYQLAVIKESKTRKEEFQYLLAGVNTSALQKQQSWANQLSSLTQAEIQDNLERARLMVRARDDFADLASLTAALEGTIDTNSSAITSLLDKAIRIVRKNNELQAEGLKNPLMGGVANTPVDAAQHGEGEKN